MLQILLCMQMSWQILSSNIYKRLFPIRVATSAERYCGGEQEPSFQGTFSKTCLKIRKVQFLKIRCVSSKH